MRQVKKPELRKQEIALAARKMFLEKDYERTTMQDIMSTLGIAKGTIYHYFKSKEDLLEVVVQDIVDEYMDQVREAFANQTGNALDRIHALIKAGRVAESQKESLQQLHRTGNIAMHSRLLAITVTRLAIIYAEVIEQGCKEGLFHVEHPLESAELLLAGIQFLTDEGCYPWSESDLSRRMRTIPALFEAQLKAPLGSFDFLLKGISINES